MAKKKEGINMPKEKSPLLISKRLAIKLYPACEEFERTGITNDAALRDEATKLFHKANILTLAFTAKEVYRALAAGFMMMQEEENIRLNGGKRTPRKRGPSDGFQELSDCIMQKKRN